MVKTLARSARRKNSGGAPLPTVFKSLAQAKALFRRAEFSMVCAQPNAGKSFFALWHAVTWVKDHGLRVLYFSADSSELVVASRVASMVSGFPTEQSERDIKQGQGRALSALAEVPGLEFSFDPELTTEVLDLEVHAFIEKWGQAPDVIFLDNLSDVEASSGADEWAGLREVGRMATTLARKMGPAVIALHHTSESKEGQYEPGYAPSRAAIQGKVSVKQSLVLTLGEVHRGMMPVAVVKSRFGQADKSGRRVHRVQADLSTGQFADPDWQAAA